MKKYLLLLIVLQPFLAICQDGLLDTTFGVNGTVTLNNMGRIAAIDIQPDGKIVGILQYSNQAITNLKIVVFRSNMDGTLDPDFGIDGKAILDLGNNFQVGNDIKVSQEGKILVAAGGQDSSNYTSNIYRLNSSGIVDINFGVLGRIQNCGDKIAIQPDGKFVSAKTNTSATGYVVFKHNQDGSPDTAFNVGQSYREVIIGNQVQFIDVISKENQYILTGVDVQNPTNGIKTIMINQEGTESVNVLNINNQILFVQALLNGPANSFFEIASQNTLPNPFSIIKHYTDNINNLSFGTNSAVNIDTNTFSDQTIAHGGVMQPDGKIIIYGFTEDSSNSGQKWAMARLLPNGSLDNSYGVLGVSSSSTPAAENNVKAILCPVTGKLVVIGFASENTNQNDLIVKRFNTGINLKTTFFTAGTKIILHPIPVSNILKIEFGEQIETLLITDMLGRVCNATALAVNQFDVSNLRAGMYFIALKSGNKTYTEKFIKE